MRELTKGQKNFLNKILADQNYRDRFGEIHIGIRSINDLPSGVFEELEEMHDTEVLWQNTNRYIMDKVFSL